MKRNNFLAIPDQELVPGVDLGRLIDENLLKVLELHGPLVDVLLELSEGQAGASGGGACGVGHAGKTGLSCTRPSQGQA